MLARELSYAWLQENRDASDGCGMSPSVHLACSKRDYPRYEGTRNEMYPCASLMHQLPTESRTLSFAPALGLD